MQDFAEAAHWLRKAMEYDLGASRRDATVKLGLRYRYGFDNEQNRDEALRFLAEPAAANDTGTLLEAGAIMVDHDDPAVARRGFLMLLQAAARGDVTAQNHLGLAYANGRGTSASFGTAAVWYERAPLAGNRTAARNLAELLEGDYLGKADLEAAVKWYRMAADGGQSAASRRLADILSRSDDPADRAEAFGYLVADAGGLNPNAAEMLAQVIDDAAHPLHELATGPEHVDAVAQAALAIGAGFEEPWSAAWLSLRVAEHRTGGSIWSARRRGSGGLCPWPWRTFVWRGC